jgi:hypothetical protein
VEVVASVLLVGTLLVGILIAHRRAASQTRLAYKRLEAIRALDALLTARQQQSAPELQLARGKPPGNNPFYWRSSLREEPALVALEASILRVELYDPDYLKGETLASVELVAPGAAMEQALARK